MCFNATVSLSSAVIMFGIAVILGFRNQPYDRMLAMFIVALGLIQTCEFLIHSQITGSDLGARLLFNVLWLQIFVLFFGLYLQSPSSVNLALAVVSGLWLVGMICKSATGTFYGGPGKSGHLEWSRDGGPLLGNLGWLYMIGLFSPLLLMMLDLPIKGGILVLYGIFSAIYVYTNFPPAAFSSMWCFLSIGFSLLTLI